MSRKRSTSAIASSSSVRRRAPSLHQLAVAPPDRPAREMQVEPAFLESVRDVRSLLDKIEDGEAKQIVVTTKPPANPSDGFGASLKRAFTWHWHLLGLAAGVAFAVLSGAPAHVASVFGGGRSRLHGIARAEPAIPGGAEGSKSARPRTRRRSIRRGAFSNSCRFSARRMSSDSSLLHQRCSELLDLRRRMDAKEGDVGRR